MIKEVKTKTFGKVMYEMFNSANEVVETGSRRNITSSSFSNMRDGSLGGHSASWCGGVSTFEEAEKMMREGYQPTVDKMKANIKANVQWQGKRISFFNDVVGYAPIVPLALQGVPAAMQNAYMKPIKAKVLNVYYDMTASCGTKSEDIIEAGQKLLAAIMELEMQGYKFNLYAIQSYAGSKDVDILCTKIKNSNTPLDLKRISFSLTHTAYFRVIGFDWYSRCPKATYRGGYGHALGYDYNERQMAEGFKEIFGENAVVFSCSKVIGNNTEHLKEVMTDAGKGKK